MSFFDDASLVFLPSGEAGKDGKAYSMKPTNGNGDFTFSRGSNLTATRVDSNGLIEKGRENLLKQSNQFDTTWSGNASVTSGQSGYDGSSDAWLLEKDNTGSFKSISQNLSLSGVWTFSLYAKANSLDSLTLRNQTNGHSATFDLTNATISTNQTIDESIVSVGNNWYRCTATFSGSSSQLAIYVGYANSSAGSIYIQDAQLEIGLAATEYIESGATTGLAGILEDSPRFDYSGGASCPSLLLEPSRTNLIKQTEYFGDSQWLVDGVSLDANNITSPEGLQNAYKITDDTTTGYHLITDSDVFLADGVMRTWSVFVKKGTARYCVIGAGNQFVVQDNALIFDMEGGTYTSTGTSSFFDTIHDPINMGNGWYRIGFSSDLNSSSYNKLSIGVSQGATWSGNVSYTGDGSLNYYIFGAQVEEGSYPTSYIPNHSGGSVTRNVDDLNDLSVSVNNEGTFYFETKDRIFENESSNKNYLGLRESSSGNYFRFRGQSSSILIQSIGFGSNISFNPSGASLTKYLYKWDGTTIKVFVDGVERGSVSQTARFEPDTFRKAGGGSIGFSSNLKQLLFFTTALSDAECIALTS